eukprot:10145264-Alexandrium_andersonii.AAC.1
MCIRDSRSVMGPTRLLPCNAVAEAIYKSCFDFHPMETLEAIAAVRDIDVTFRRHGEGYWRGRMEHKLFCARRWMLTKAPVWARTQ